MNRPLIIPTSDFYTGDTAKAVGQVINVWTESEEEYEELAKAAELITNAWLKGMEKNE